MIINNYLIYGPGHFNRFLPKKAERTRRHGDQHQKHAVQTTGP